jgi:DNA sulfur modification protein DndD
MRIEVLGWRSKGLRCADLDFDFKGARGAPPAGILIQMPNGTGKTTTLNCIRAAFTGEAANWSQGEVSGYAPRGSGSGGGEFELRLRIDSEQLTIGIQFDFDSNTVRYTTTYGRGKRQGFEPPLAMRRFMTRHFVRLLVFDGELPHELLDASETRAQEAIDAFFQLYLLPDVETAVESAFAAATESASATHERGLTRRRNQVVAAKKKIIELERSLAKSKDALRVCLERRKALAAKIDEEGRAAESVLGEKSALEAKLVFAKSERERACEDLIQVIRRPHRLHRAFKKDLLELRAHLDRLKLPESTSKQFFIELADERSCVCGRDISPEIREHILEKAKSYLGTDTYGALNHMKSQIQKLVQEGTPQPGAEELACSVNDADRECSQIETELARIQRQIVAQSGEEVQQVQRKIDALDEEIAGLEMVIEAIESPPDDDDGDDSHSLKYWKELHKSRERQLSEVTRTVHLRFCKNRIVETLKRAHGHARRDLSREVVKEMNAAIDSLLPGHDITVKGLYQSLVLDGQGGASLGQTLAVGYAFLTTLFGRGGHEFPFVVDAPVTALDGRVRMQVAQIIPRVSAQFVTFILDTEKPNFVPVLEQHYGDDLLYLTAFEDSEKNADLLAILPDAGVTRSRNGVIVAGREYFARATFKEE